MFKTLFSLLLFVSMLHATTVVPSKNLFQEGESLSFSLTGMSGDTTDWIGIYPEGASNDWGNVQAFKWTRWNAPKTSGTITLDALPLGNYEVRAFFHNSYKVEARHSFKVGAGVEETSIQMQKAIYAPQESIRLTLTTMPGNSRDWVGIYPVGTNNSWSNVKSWSFTKGITNGSLTLQGLVSGEYEARVFFNNSYHLETFARFTVKDDQQKTVSIKTNKEIYEPNSAITLTLSNMAGNDKDWIGIYPVGSSNSWNNVKSWKFTQGIVNGTITLSGVAAGTYEARAFFNNSYHLETSYQFTVKNNNGGGGSSNAKIFIIGDSTVHNATHGEMGWGSQLGSYMKHPSFVKNRARSGASSKSYNIASASHHDWGYTKNLMENTDVADGAYLFIQFGHNDEKAGTLHTSPGRYNSFYNQLKSYLDQARDLGFIPVLITPVSRQYVGSRTHGDYPKTMKELAEDEGVILLDLEYKSYLEFKKYPSDAALQKVFHYDDGTHFNPNGAKIVAGWVKELACNANQALCQQFK